MDYTFKQKSCRTVLVVGNPLSFIDPLGLAACSPWIALGYSSPTNRYEKKTGKWSDWSLELAEHKRLKKGGALLTCYWARSRTISEFLFIDKTMIYERTCMAICGTSFVERKSELELDQEGQLILERIERQNVAKPHKTWAADWSSNYGIRPDGLCRSRYNLNIR